MLKSERKKELVHQCFAGREAVALSKSDSAPQTLLSMIASYLVDPASSHMLVSKIKPCMSKYKPH
jgi:hypothetical protein